MARLTICRVLFEDMEYCSEKHEVIHLHRHHDHFDDGRLITVSASGRPAQTLRPEGRGLGGWKTAKTPQAARPVRLCLAGNANTSDGAKSAKQKSTQASPPGQAEFYTLGAWRAWHSIIDG